MYYAVTFVKGLTTKNTWTDWHLVPSSRPVINPPKPKKTIIEVPGSNTVIDLTEYLTGDVTYSNRTGSIEFYVMNDKPQTWYDLYSEIMDFLQGQKVQLYLEEEYESVPKYYYEGRVEVNEWRSEKDYSKIVIDYDLDPFKYKFPATSEVIPLRGSSVSRTYTNSGYSVIPVFTVEAGSTNVTVTFRNNTYSLATGQQVVAGIVFERDSTNNLSFNGTGSIQVSYKERRL